MVCKPRKPTTGKRSRLVVILLVLGLPAFGQVTSRLSDRFLVVTEQLTYTILIDHEEPSDVRVTAPTFDGLRLIDGPFVRPVTVNSAGVNTRSVEVRFVFTATDPGRYVLPAVSVAVAGQAYRTDRHLVEVAPVRDRALVPFRARWSGPAGPLLVGQGAVYALEIFNIPEFLYPDSLSFGSSGNAIMEELQGLGEIARIEVDGARLYTIPVAVFMVTATSPGSFRLPSVTIESGPIEVRVPSQQIPVDPLPAPVESTGAVGAFSYDVVVSPETVPVGQSLTVTQRVTGSGNLHFLSLPSVEVTGFQIADEQTRSQFIARETGYQGQVERTFTVTALSSGPYRIEAAPFVAVAPASRRIDRQNGPVIVPIVTQVREPVLSDGARGELDLLTVEEIRRTDRLTWFSSPLSYGWFVPGVLFLIASRFWRRASVASVVMLAALLIGAVRVEVDYAAVREGLHHFDSGDVDGAIGSLERERRRAGAVSGLEYNLAVLYFKIGDVPRAVYAAREAVRLSPRDPRMRELLSIVEESEGIERSMTPRQFVHPDLFFALLAGSVNVLAVMTAFAMRRKRGLFVIGQLVAGIGLLVSLGGLLATASLHNERPAIVRTEYDLRRIPNADSEGWLVVDAGTAVQVVATQEQFILVRTAVGLEGWVGASELLWPGNHQFENVRYRTISAETE